MVRWPSWLWRQVKVELNNCLLVGKPAWVQVPLSSSFLLHFVNQNLLCVVCLQVEIDDGLGRWG